MKEKTEKIIGSVMLLILTSLLIWGVYKIIEGGLVGVFTQIIILITPFLCILFIRYWIVRLVKKYMQKESVKEKSNLPEELELPEEKAGNKPSFVNIDKTIKSDKTIQLREKFVSEAYRLFRKKYFFNVIACLGYFFFPFSFSRLGIVTEHVNNGIVFITFISFIYFLYISLQFLFFRKQFRPRDSSFGKKEEQPESKLRWIPLLWIIPSLLNFIKTTYKIIFFVLKKILEPKRQAYALVVFMAINFLLVWFYLKPFPANQQSTGIIYNFGLSLGVFAAILLHIFLIIYLLRVSKKHPNYTLLILRVFGSNEQVSLTFGQFVRFWQHFGTWFTIVDPSFLSTRFKVYNLKTLTQVILLYFLVALFFGVEISFLKNESEFTVWLCLIIFILLALFGSIIYWQQHLIRSFPKDEIDVTKRINKILNHPRRFDLTFKNLPVFCYDNIWRHAVNALLIESHAVLMDLRGFSEARKGCEYEIDFLFDTFPINRIVFLADNGTDRDFICEVILARWEYLRVNSPNLSISNPEAKIFICQTEEDEADVQTMMDLLIEASNLKDKTF